MPATAPEPPSDATPAAPAPPPAPSGLRASDADRAAVVARVAQAEQRGDVTASDAQALVDAARAASTVTALAQVVRNLTPRPDGPAAAASSATVAAVGPLQAARQAVTEAAARRGAPQAPRDDARALERRGGVVMAACLGCLLIVLAMLTGSLPVVGAAIGITVVWTLAAGVRARAAGR